MELCNDCRHLNKGYEFSQNGLVCHYHYYCITPSKGFNTLKKWTQEKDVWKPIWCPLRLSEISNALIEHKDIKLSSKDYQEGLRKPENDQRTRRRIHLRP